MGSRQSKASQSPSLKSPKGVLHRIPGPSTDNNKDNSKNKIIDLVEEVDSDDEECRFVEADKKSCGADNDGNDVHICSDDGGEDGEVEKKNRSNITSPTNTRPQPLQNKMSSIQNDETQNNSTNGRDVSQTSTGTINLLQTSSAESKITSQIDITNNPHATTTKTKTGPVVVATLSPQEVRQSNDIHSINISSSKKVRNGSVLNHSLSSSSSRGSFGASQRHLNGQKRKSKKNDTGLWGDIEFEFGSRIILSLSDKRRKLLDASPTTDSTPTSTTPAAAPASSFPKKHQAQPIAPVDMEKDETTSTNHQKGVTEKQQLQKQQQQQQKKDQKSQHGIEYCIPREDHRYQFDRPVVLTRKNPVILPRHLRFAEQEDDNEHDRQRRDDGGVAGDYEGLLKETESVRADESGDEGYVTNTRNLTTMTLIEHSSVLSTNPYTGYPVRRFSVFGTPDDIIFDFEMNVRLSSIPNSGNGVFLTFLGARELRPSLKKMNKALLQQRYHVPPALGVQKMMETLDGTKTGVTFKAQHLDVPYNSPFVIRPLKMQSTIRRARQDVNVKFHDSLLPYSALEMNARKHPMGRVGHMRLYQESDYIPAPERTFSSLMKRCGFIDIGRYGPFRNCDRKTETLFDLKSFIFGVEPAEWGFGVEEKLFGEGQVIDITDDVTGEPSHIAKQNIPMYVNEVGHDKTLKHTVHARTARDQEVHYYLKIDEPMRAGETIEIFVDYFESYEQVRERKGYGKKNLAGEMKSDDNLPTYLVRNFGERDNMAGIIEDLAPMNLYRIVDFLVSIRRRLGKEMEKFISFYRDSNGPSYKYGCPVSVLQLLAMRRLQWLSQLLRARLNVLIDEGRYPPPGPGILSQCAMSISQLEWTSWDVVLSVLESNPDLHDQQHRNISKCIEKEMIEEVWYELKDQLARPMDPSTWCAVSRTFMAKLSKATACALWSSPETIDNKSDIQLKLLRTLVSEVKCASSAIYQSCKEGVPPHSLSFQKQMSRNEKKSCIFVTSSSTAPSSFSSNTSLKGEYLTLDSWKEKGNNNDHDQFVLHTVWYICFQILVVADLYAKKFILGQQGQQQGQSQGGLYSLEYLCHAINENGDGDEGRIDLKVATLAIQLQKQQLVPTIMTMNDKDKDDNYHIRPKRAARLKSTSISTSEGNNNYLYINNENDSIEN